LHEYGKQSGKKKDTTARRTTFMLLFSSSRPSRDFTPFKGLKIQIEMKFR